jgi:hypothetical protein
MTFRKLNKIFKQFFINVVVVKLMITIFSQVFYKGFNMVLLLALEKISS